MDEIDMSTSTADYSEIKAALKEALIELFQERRELFHDLFKEVIEETDFAEGLISTPASYLEAARDEGVEQAVESEIKAFRRLHPTLLAEHAGEYVAIINQELVDHDAEKQALYQRIQERYPKQFVLMRRVESEPERELEFRSTRYFVHSA